MEKKKMTKDIVPEGFTMKLALVDALPVLFFGGSAVLAGILLASPLFIFGAVLCFLAGAAKVLWKIIVVCKKKNVWWLFIQMRILMPIGFILMIAGAIIGRKKVDWTWIRKEARQLPPMACFMTGVVGMILMIVFAVRLDSSDPKANWIEQLTNGIAQAAFFAGLMTIVWKKNEKA